MYTVTPGDSLSKIAGEEHVKGGWQRLYENNRAVVGDDPDLIIPGQRLTLRITAPGKPKKAVPAPRAARPADIAPPKKAVPEKAVPKKAAPSTQGALPRTAPAKAAPARKPPAAASHTNASPKPVTRTSHKPAAKPATKPATRPAPKPASRPSAPSYSAPVSADIGTRYGTRGSSWSSGYHTGVDFPVPTGTSVKAVAGGRVVSAGWGGAYGYQIVVRHDDGRYSQYGHLSALTVREGQRVHAGQRIARSGSTGNSSGPHLHFEIRTGPGYGSDIDPLAYLRARGVAL
jgi:murein DD-endopeptidase MepM/ murein hydrolase activator NlpD